MKKISKVLTLVLAVSLFAFTGSNAQVGPPLSPPLLVRVPPAPPKGNIRPARPNKYLVWVAEDWAAVENKYIYHVGYWQMPPTSKSVYVPGYWKKTPNGYYRVPGYWKTPHV